GCGLSFPQCCEKYHNTRRVILMWKWAKFIMLFAAVLMLLSACNTTAVVQQTNTKAATEAPAKLNQPPVEPVVTRNGNTVSIEMTAQVTNVEISKGVFYNVWTFNGTVPGPVLRVKEGDMINFTLKNMDPYIPHSMDFHAVHAAPSKK